MSALASKLLTLGVLAALGGAGISMSPTASAKLATLAGAPSEAAAPISVSVEADETTLATLADPMDEEVEAIGESGARELAHARRDAFRELSSSARAAREAIERPAPGEGARGLDAADREAMRAIRVARIEAVHALNAAHRAGVVALAGSAAADDSASAPDHGRGRSSRAHGR